MLQMVNFLMNCGRIWGEAVTSYNTADVEIFELYDDNGKLQSDINDLQRYGEVIIDTSLEDVEQ